MAVDVHALYRRYAPMVMRRCRALLADEPEAADALQEVFVHVLRRQDVLDATAPSSLLYRIATNECLNRLRRRRRHPEDPKSDLLERIVAATDAETGVDRRSLLAKLFGRHSESTQTIAVLHLVDGMTLEEVAREVGLSVSGVRKRLRVLKSSLAELEGMVP